MSADKKQDIDLGITRFEYGEMERPQRAVLTISTGKGFNGGLRSCVTVFWLSPGSRSTMLGLGGGGDFSKTVKVSDRTVRATQKAIDTQHAEVFTPEAIEELKQAATAHYAKYISAGIDGYKNTYAAQEVKA